jgi:hypothetical protein
MAQRTRRGTITAGVAAFLALFAVIPIAALTLGGCAGDSETGSCVEVQYTGGRLIDCGSKATFVPDVFGASDEEEARPWDSIKLQPSLIGVLVTKLVAESKYTSCRSIEIPEGRWTICDGGFSLLERNEKAERSAARADAR